MNITDTPQAGFYRMRLRRGGPPCGIRIWFGPPRDPDTGEEMDRAPRWQATANGDLIDVERVWPVCAADTITEAKCLFMERQTAHARATDAFDPLANPRKAVDWDTATPPSF